MEATELKGRVVGKHFLGTILQQIRTKNKKKKTKSHLIYFDWILEQHWQKTDKNKMEDRACLSYTMSLFVTHTHTKTHIQNETGKKQKWYRKQNKTKKNKEKQVNSERETETEENRGKKTY